MSTVADTRSTSGSPVGCPTDLIDVDPTAGTIIDLVAGRVLVVDANGLVVFASRQVCDLLGYEVLDLVGHPVADLVAAEAGDVRARLYAALARGAGTHPRPCGLRVIGRRRDGGTVPLHVELGPMGEGLLVASVRPAHDADDDAAAQAKAPQISERDRHTRAIVDIVVQRLFAIAARLAATTLDASGGEEALRSSIELIDDTIELVRTEVLERYDGREDVSAMQAELLERRSAGRAG